MFITLVEFKTALYTIFLICRILIGSHIRSIGGETNGGVINFNFVPLLHKSSRFHIAVLQFSNRSRITSKKDR